MASSRSLSYWLGDSVSCHVFSVHVLKRKIGKQVDRSSPPEQHHPYSTNSMNNNGAVDSDLKDWSDSIGIAFTVAALWRVVFE